MSAGLPAFTIQRTGWSKVVLLGDRARRAAVAVALAPWRGECPW